jgi:hypothetical protein
MQCVSPLRIKSTRIANDEGVVGCFYDVPCGKCVECLTNRRVQWSLRLQLEQKNSYNSKFVTLTYDEDHVKTSLDKFDCQLFLKRLRHNITSSGTYLSKNLKVPENALKYYLAGEYGSQTKRPHYHAIMFNLPFSKNDLIEKVELRKLLLHSWGNGEVDIGNVTPASIHYVSGYIMEDVKDKFCLMSKGLGKGYLTDEMVNYHKEKLETQIRNNGEKFKMPRYFSQKIFNKYEKEEISRRSQLISDLRDNKERQEINKKTIEPEQYKLLRRQQFVDRAKKSLIKNKSL